ncbi:DNA-3-methyladenine glycosylase I [Alteromonadaceae bacterium M269]|nr:DNA-3-methyladenine glycosylase I [Alteromonadaceae bacterium M269]
MEEQGYLEPFSRLYQRACERKGGEKRLESLLGRPLSSNEISQIPDDRFLAEFTKKVFQAGFVWRVIENKWDNFERLFFGFDVEKVLLMPDEMLEQRAQNPDIIRNYNRVKTIRENALMISDVSRDYGSFGKFVASFDSTNVIDLWLFLKKRGARLGGNSGPYALRALGKDTFVLSPDVVAYFTNRGIISGSATSKRSLTAIQESFAQLHKESGRSLQELSLIIAFGVGDNRVGY